MAGDKDTDALPQTHAWSQISISMNCFFGRDEIANPGCKARVHKIMEYASTDIRFDVPLANACYEDRQDFCSNVPPGSARVIRCLQERYIQPVFLPPSNPAFSHFKLYPHPINKT